MSGVLTLLPLCLNGVERATVLCSKILKIGCDLTPALQVPAISRILGNLEWWGNTYSTFIYIFLSLSSNQST